MDDSHFEYKCTPKSTKAENHLHTIFRNWTSLQQQQWAACRFLTIE
jgi:hypothetical protein